MGNYPDGYNGRVIDFIAWFLVLLGLVSIAIVFLDSFETIVLPRTVKRPIRLTNLFFIVSRRTFMAIAGMKQTSRRQTLLVAFAPLMLFGLIFCWALLLIVGFALVGAGINMPFHAGETASFGDRMYFSGITFFTIGYGDFTPITPGGKLLAVLEGGTGFGFLALVVSYVPVLYSAFSRREVTILLLDSKAGSDPTAAEILRRHAEAGCMTALTQLLKDWEVFSAQLLENYLSYPVLAFYRSQHDDQSWLRSLCAIMDTCAICHGGCEGHNEFAPGLTFQAKATFTMARHLVVDFAYVVNAEPEEPPERFTPENIEKIRAVLRASGVHLSTDPAADNKIEATRKLYEPYIRGLARRLSMDMPDLVPAPNQLDNWQTSAWDGKHF